ncbi:hypothetical protein [Streptomyces sp. L7]|uniref:hypothetical protein n=2 Tax=Actinomycetes TaxID=1760 RepID=UPI003D95507E
MLGLSSACAGLSVVAMAPALAQLAGAFLLHALGGLLASYVVHESAHAALLRRTTGIQVVEVITTFSRFTFAPKGVLRGRNIAMIGGAGPIAAFGTGVALLVLVPALGLHWWYLGHLLFLLPVFGDGKSILVGVRSWTRPVTL